MASHPIASPAPAPAPSSPPTPPPVHFGKVAIIGVGLIGGSLGMVLTHEQMADEIVGIGRRVENLKTAVALGAIHRYVTDSQEGIRDADLIVLATPVDTYERQVRAWRPWLHPGAIVTDVGSVKGALVERVEQLLPSGIRFVGAHPIAGREKTGVAAGSLTLFRQARCILTPTATTDAAALQQIRAMWEQAGSTVLTMDPHLHDRVLGAVFVAMVMFEAQPIRLTRHDPSARPVRADMKGNAHGIRLAPAHIHDEALGADVAIGFVARDEAALISLAAVFLESGEKLILRVGR